MQLDDAMNEMKSALDYAAQKTSDAMDSTKKLVDRQKMRRRLNELYRKLGKAEYEAALGGVTSMSEINALISEITMLRQCIAEIELHLYHSNGAFCSVCGKKTNQEDSYCSACGAPIHRK